MRMLKGLIGLGGGWLGRWKVKGRGVGFWVWRWMVLGVPDGVFLRVVLLIYFANLYV